jgi:pyruvate kinase
MHRKTKIIATLGPATATPEGIAGLVAAGMDVARLNFSHGTHETHRLWTGWVREAAADQGRAVAMLQDIQGPRIRVGTFPGGSVELRRGEQVTLRPGDGEAEPGTVFVQYLDAADLAPGDRVLLNDGMVEVQVLEAAAGEARVEVCQGGRLSDRKGAAFPGIRLDLPAITAKDREDLTFGAEIGVDLVAASFVETADDIAAVREIVGDTPVIAKVERSAAYANLAGLLAVADGAMVARGDLGVELGYEPLPRIQKEIIAAANSAGRISITATEMLESMISSPRPTRAEVTDVANAVMDGSDAVMLSAETAVGADPVRAVEVMAAVCREAERSPGYLSGHRHDFVGSDQTFASAIALATAETSNNLGLSAVVAFTESGSTARLISKYRPRADILAFTPSAETYRRMALLWGVTPMHFERQDSTDEMIAIAERLLLDRGLLAAGDPVAMVAGIPPNQDASTNLLKLHSMGEWTGSPDG